MAHTFASLTTHIVFGTKDRFPAIDHEVLPLLHAYLGGIARNIGCTPLSIGGVSDHVHLLIGFKTVTPIADIVEKIKANSSKWVRPGIGLRSKFQWQKGYSAFSVSPSNVDKVRRYLESQEEHHKRESFRDEYVRFLEECGIDFEDRYLFE
jgi:putative transposase